MTQETNQTPITISATDTNDKVQKFISKNKVYLQGELYREGKDFAIDVKPGIMGDSDKLKEVRSEAQAFGGVLHFTPKARVLFPNAPMAILEGYSLHFRKKEDFEWGGPQPRIWLLDDPELVALANNIELNGQREPVDASPSPTGSGKLWLIEGHGRFTSIFEILAKRDPNRWTGIWTKEKKRTKLECFEDSVILNGKKKLSAYELGTFIRNLQEEFPDVYKANVHGFSFQETVAKRLGISRSRVSEVLSAHDDVKGQVENLPEQICRTATKLPEQTINELRKAPDQVKSTVYTVAIEKHLEASDTKKLVSSVTTKPSMSQTEIEAEAERIKQEKALPKPEPIPEPQVKTEEEIAAEDVARLEKGDAKTEKRIERSIEKAIAAGSHFPEDLMISVHGHLAKDTKDGKVDDEKAEAYAKKAVTIMYERISEEDLESIFAEADQIP